MMDRKAVKAEAKGILGRARMSPYVTTLLVLGTGFLLSRLTDWVQGGSPLYSYELQARYYDALTGGDPAALERLLYALPEDTGAGFFCSVLVSLVMLTLYGGYYLYCMGVRRGAVMPYATLADGLGAAGRLIWCGVQMAVKIFLWSLLLGIPGIIAAYRYRFAYYNILTDDNITAGEAIRRSCRQTKGLKWELFLLDLSFLGWAVLAQFTFGLLHIWLTPYMTLCDLAYFEEGQRNVGRSPYGEG